VQTGGAPAATPNLAVQTGGAPNEGDIEQPSSFTVDTGAPANNYLTNTDFKYIPPAAETEQQEGYFDNDNNWVAPSSNPYAGGIVSFNGQNFAAPTLQQAGGKYATPYYEARTNQGELAAAVMANEGQGVRLLDETGNVLFQGTGPDAARNATAIANQLSTSGGKTAAWNIQIEDPANKGNYTSAGYESVDKVKDHTLRNLLVDIVPQILMAVATQGLSVGYQMAGAAAATIPGSVVQHKSLTDSIFRAALAGGTAGVLKGTTVGQNITSGITKGVTGVTNAITGATVPAVVDAAVPAVAGTLSPLTVTAAGKVLPGVIKGTLDSLPGIVGSTLTNLPDPIEGQKPVDPGKLTNTPADLAHLGDGIATGPLDNLAVNPGEVDPVEVVMQRMARAGAPVTRAQVVEALGRGGTQFAAEQILRFEKNLPSNHLTNLPDPIEGQKPADPGKLTNTPADLAHLGDGIATGPLDKVAKWAKAHPLEAVRLGLNAASGIAGAVSGGGGKSSGAGGDVGGTLAQLRANLSPTYSAQLGAPRGMFSALGTAGTPYTPRPISNLLPDAAVKTGGSGGVNPSGTAALSDYLRRYPDVAAEAAKNPGAYDDVNEDGVIDDNDFALMHYILHGKDEGRTLAVKTGGYIENPSRDTDMHNSRFQVMRKAEGGAVDQRPYTLGPLDEPIYSDPAPTTAPSMVGPLKQPVASQLAQSFAVDPRALAESYRAGATGALQPLSVMQQRQSPYSGYDPGTMGGMYHYGESPTGETQHFNYALAQGSVAPWMASTPTGTGSYNMFGVRRNDGVGTGGGGTPTTPTTPTTPATAPISDAERAKWTAYVNAYPDLAKAYAENNAAYKDFNNDGKVDIADFGLGQYTNYGQKEGRSLTGPAASTASTGGSGATIGAPGAKYNNSAADIIAAAKIMGFDATAPGGGPTGIDPMRMGDMLLTQFRDGTMTKGIPAYNALLAAYGGADETPNAGGSTTGYGSNVSNQTQEWMDARQGYWDALNNATSSAESDAALRRWNAAQGLKKGGPAGGQGRSNPRSQFAVQGPGTGRSDSIPAVLSDGEYVMDAETVALLGDGSSKAGAKKLDVMRGNLRKHKGRSLAQGRFSVNAKAPEKYLSGGRT